MNHKSTINLLLIEDELADVHLIKIGLNNSSVPSNLHHVSDGVEAFEYLNKKPPYILAPRPDIILLDLNLARMNGKEFLTLIKNEDQFKSIPVIILTTSQSQRDIETMYELGGSGFITKPIDISEFNHILDVLLKYWAETVKLPKGP